MASVWAFIVLTLAVVPVFAQRGQITTQGKEFWLTFMKNPQSGLFADTLELSVFITTKNPCSVTVENPTTGWRNTCFMMQNTYNQIIIPVAQAYLQTPSENPVAKGIRIVATDTVSVYSANFRSASYDASNVLPISLLGNEYILQTYPPIVDIFSFEDYYSVFAIVGTENNTVVDITPSVPIVTDTLRPAGTRFSVTLGSGEVVYMRSKEINMLGDVSGTV
ncbi:MAG: IgGFc-binding protein, partial [Bacteroidales bacterium]|nr:IgGFc-binding protein [Bacteroidales bacterium]